MTLSCAAHSLPVRLERKCPAAVRHLSAKLRLACVCATAEIRHCHSVLTIEHSIYARLSNAPGHQVKSSCAANFNERHSSNVT